MKCSYIYICIPSIDSMVGLVHYFPILLTFFLNNSKYTTKESYKYIYRF